MKITLEFEFDDVDLEDVLKSKILDSLPPADISESLSAGLREALDRLVDDGQFDDLIFNSMTDYVKKTTKELLKLEE